MKKLFMFMMLTVIVSIGFAAAADYTFGYTAGTYTEITGGTLTSISSDDGAENIALPWSFTYDGILYFNARICANGWLKFYNGTAPTDTDYTNGISTTNLLNSLCPLWDDLHPGSPVAAEIRYESLGSAPNRTFVVQWKNILWQLSGGTAQNFQLRLEEGTNVINFVYGAMTAPGGTPTASIGIIDATGGSGHYQSVTPGDPPTVSSTTPDDAIAAITYLTSGTTYTFTPPTPTAVPNLATPVYPTDTLTGVFTTSNLEWADGGGWTTGFKLYFGTTNGDTNPPWNIVNGTDLGLTLSYDPTSDMAFNTMHYWKIVPYNSFGDNTAAVVWSFTTSGEPLAGDKYIGGATPDYTTFTDAINALNANGITGTGVTFLVAADAVFAEDVPEITMTGSATQPIVFQKTGTGANPVIKPIAAVAGISILGGDYITFDGIDVTREGTSTTDYGYSIKAASATDGAQYNTIRNCKITMDRTDTGTRGIYHYYTQAPTDYTGTNSNNEYNNVAVENSYYGIYMYGTSSTTYIEDNNKVRNCIIGSTNPGDIGGGSSTAYGMYIYYQKDATINNNIVRNVSASTTVYGMYLYYLKGIENKIYANQLHDIAYTGTSTSLNYGMYIYPYTTNPTTVKVFNNMIWGQTHGHSATATATKVMYGIYIGSGGASNNHYIDFNSVYIVGPTTASSFCIGFGSVGATNYLRNNVLTNYTGEQTTSYHGCIYTSSSSNIIGITGSVSDNNILYVDNATQGYTAYGSTTVPYVDLSAWSTATGYDLYSYASDPEFISATDLHISTTEPTRVESNGSYFEGAINWVTDDIDPARTVRNTTTPDIGADEGDFTPVSGPPLAPVYISPVDDAQNVLLTELLNWAPNSEGGPPTSYDVYFGESDPPPYVDNVTETTYSPVLAYSTSYYWKIVARNGDGTADGPVWSFTTVAEALSGNKYIGGITPDYTTFTDAVNALNVAGIGTGGVTFLVAADAVFAEDVPEITMTGTATQPIIFQKDGVGANPVIKPSTATAGISILGGDYITFDGIDVTREGTSTTDYGYSIKAASATDGAQYNTIKNCKITLDNTDSGTRGIYHYYTQTPTDYTGTNSNNEYNNVTVENSYYGIYMYGTSSTTYIEDNNIISSCTIGGDTAGSISGPYGMYLYYQKDLEVSNNEVRNIEYSSTVYGMYIYYLKGTESEIYNNKVHDIAYTGISTSANYGMYIYLYTTGANEVKVYNNMIWGQTSGYTGTGSSSYAIHGIYMSSAGSSNTYNVDFNSVRVEGPADMSSSALYFTSTSGVNKIRNNVLTNFTGESAYANYHVCLYVGNATAVGATGSVSDHNVMYVANALGGYPVRGSTTNYTTLGEWQTASGMDLNSVSNNPQFISATDLHISTTAPTVVESNGSYFEGAITWVTSDIDPDRDIRNTTTPDIGADEGDFIPLAGVPGHVTLIAPADLATDVSPFNTVLQWLPADVGGLPSYYEVFVGASPLDPGNEYYGEYFYETTATSLNLTEQTDIEVGFSATWYWAVLPHNDSGNPDPTGMTVYRFTTLPDPTIIALPYAEYFDDVTAPALPYGWTGYVNSTSTYAVVVTASSTTYAVTQPNYARMYNSTDATADLRLITPMIDASIPLSNIKLKFYARGSGTGDNVLIGTVDVPDGTGVFTLIDSLVLTTTQTEYTYSLDSYVGTDQYICFKLGTGETYNYAYIDNVQLIEILANDLAATELYAPPYAIQGSPVDFEVTVFNEGTATQTEYTIKLYDEFDTELASQLVTYTLDPLAYGTHTISWTPAATGVFNVYGKVVLTGDQNAANDETATWPVTVVTSTTYLPWSEYFDLVTPPALPQGWTAIKNATSTSAYADTYASTTYSVSAPNCARLANSSDAAADLRLVLPEILLPVNSVRMSFYARGSSGYTLLVGTMDARDGVFTQYASIDLTSTQTQYNVEFNAYAGTDTYIAFKHGLGGTYRTIYLDNVELTEIFDNDLAAQAFTIPNYGYVGSAYDFTFDVKNVGLLTQSSYDVKLINAAGDVELATQTITTAIDPGVTAQHTLQWTPAVEGQYNIYGKVVLTGDQGPANDASAAKAFYVLPMDIDILTVGDPETTTSVNYLPTNVYYKNGVTEELYFQDETHLLSGDILALVYKNNFTQQLDGLAFKIWMGTTTSSDLTGGWLPADSLHLVFDGTLDLPIGVNEVIIPLQTPFAYTGDNLFVRWNRVMDTVYYNSTNTWYYNNTTTTHPSRSRYLQSDATLYNPLAPEAAGTISSYVPLTWLVVDNAVTAPQAILSGYVYEFGTTTPLEGVTVNLTERASTLTDEFGYYEFVYWDSTYVDLTASKTDYYSSTVTDISFEPGTPVTQDFYLVPLPSLTVSGVVTSNDYPGGLEGATVKLFGYHNYETTSGVGGAFSIADVKGNVAGNVYTISVGKEGYESFGGETTVYEANINLGTINLIEYLWTPYNLVAEHSGDNAQLVWEPAAAPDYYFSDFEDDNGGWVESGYGDWEWTNTYNVALYDPSGSTSTQTPPPTAHSGTGLLGTIIYGPYSNSGAYSFLTQTFDFSGYTNTQLRYWLWNDLWGYWDYLTVRINGTTVDSVIVLNNTSWQERVIDLTAYDGLSDVVVTLAMFATTGVNYAGAYIDDIYIGNPPARYAEGERWFLDYDVYRFLAADEGNPGAWTQLQSGVAETTYLDTGFSALPGGVYEWAVKANYSGALQSEPILSNTLGIVATPQDITATKVGANVQLDWTAEPGASFYRIYGSDDPYTGFVYIGYSTTNTYTITAPADMKKFYYVTAGADEEPVPPTPPAIRR